MFFVGKPSILAKRLVQVTQDALYLGIRMVKPGAHLGDIGVAIAHYAHKHHYSVVRVLRPWHWPDFHEDPQVLHYGNPGTGITLEPGMTFTIELMINAGKRHVKLLPNEWTVITKDRKLSAQWEHTLAVTETAWKF